MNHRHHDGPITPATNAITAAIATISSSDSLINTRPPLRTKQSSLYSWKVSCIVILVVFLLTVTIVRVDAFSIHQQQQHYCRSSGPSINIGSEKTRFIAGRTNHRRISTTQQNLVMMSFDDATIINDPFVLQSTITLAADTTQQLLSTYMYYLDNYSIITQSCTAAFFAGIGDCIAQTTATTTATATQSDVTSTVNAEIATDTSNNESATSTAPSSTLLKTFTTETTTAYNVQRTMHYIFKGLGGGCMWGVWFDYSDSISYELTQQLLQSTFVLPTNTELGYATSISQNIDVSTAISYTLSLYHLPLISSLSGSTIQHVIHVLICILLEQFIVSPVFYSVWDIPIPALLSGSPIRQIPAQIQAKLVPLLIANAKIWTPANIITYSLPSEYRVLFASLTDVVWQTILSDITSNEITIQQQQPQSQALPSSSTIDALSSSSSETSSQGNPTLTITTTVVTAPYSESTNPIGSSVLTSGTTMKDFEPVMSSVSVTSSTTSTTTPTPLFLSSITKSTPSILE